MLFLPWTFIKILTLHPSEYLFKAVFIMFFNFRMTFCLSVYKTLVSFFQILSFQPFIFRGLRSLILTTNSKQIIIQRQSRYGQFCKLLQLLRRVTLFWYGKMLSKWIKKVSKIIYKFNCSCYLSRPAAKLN